MTLTIEMIAKKVHEIGASNIPEEKLEVLRSMCRRAKPYGGQLTEKQSIYALDILIKASQPRQEAATPAVDLSRVNAMFTRAAEQLRKPFVVFATYREVEGKTCVDREFKVSQAPEHGKNPGYLYVTARGTYVGKLSPEGQFSASREAPAGMQAALEAFAQDPAQAAIAYGQATGSCCFCAKELSDPVSVELGYGPICATRWGLPHRHTMKAEAVG
jgi:Family of unknown function (DUF6011)